MILPEKKLATNKSLSNSFNATCQFKWRLLRDLPIFLKNSEMFQLPTNWSHRSTVGFPSKFLWDSGHTYVVSSLWENWIGSVLSILTIKKLHGRKIFSLFAEMRERPTWRAWFDEFFIFLKSRKFCKFWYFLYHIYVSRRRRVPGRAPSWNPSSFPLMMFLIDRPFWASLTCALLDAINIRALLQLTAR